MTHAEALKLRGPGVPARACAGALSYCSSSLFLLPEIDDTPATGQRDVFLCLGCGDRLIFAGPYLVAVDAGNTLAAEGPPRGPLAFA